MPDLDAVRSELALANRILAREQVVDGFGHVSVRHPLRADRFLLSRSLSPALVTPSDIVEFDLDGRPVDDPRPPYLERFIHAAIYAARDDVQSIVHHHAHEVIPFSVTGLPLRPVIHMAGAIGDALPVWDIRTKFGDTNLLVADMDQARDLAATLGGGPAALMRGHGAVVVGSTIREAVLVAVYSKVNAGILLESHRLGEVTFLTPGEALLAREALLGPNPQARAWEYLAGRAAFEGE